ncbi:MAG: adenine phosphoribosyltransferase [Bifidobacteriaceae bacterium]|jgi:adenine phosphoribosyltransferase|nr:adenine phosphoribosyltransferase [Bifidobacteriaceae bacterium]
MKNQLDILGQNNAQYVLSRFSDIPDFPKKGIIFKDIMGAIADPKAFNLILDAFIKSMPSDIDYIVGIEARGFILGAALAQKLNIGFIPLRKAGKLPPPVKSVTYSLEYGEDTLEIQNERLKTGDKVFVIDDVIATGGTIEAAKQLLLDCKVDIKGFGFVIELADFGATAALQNYKVISLYKVLD